MDLSQICIILARPEESRNVGSVCRAIKNMGIGCLRVVGNRNEFDDEKVRCLAVHSADIWDRAEFYPSITEAVADCVLSAGTSRRRGKKRKSWAMTPEEFAAFAGGAGEGKVAVVFGNERTGLTDVELAECTMVVSIPSDSACPSLNLSHAVQVVSYVLFRDLRKISRGYTPVSLEQLEELVSHIGDKMCEIGFFAVAGRPEMELFWREILSRSALSAGEVKYLKMTFTKAAGLARKVSSGVIPEE